MPRARSITAPAAKGSSAQTGSSAPKGRNITAQGNALGHRPPTNPSPEGATQTVCACETGDQLLQCLLKLREEAHHGHGRYHPPVDPDITDLPELPAHWAWASPSQLSSADRHALAIGPFGSNLKVSDYRDEGVPLVFVRNIRSQSYADETKFVSASKARELASHTVDPGDILVTKMGEPPGDSSIYPTGAPQAVITADCIKWRVAPVLEPRFFMYALRSDTTKQQIAARTRGVAQKKISLERFRDLALPLPPLPEQRRIVARIEELFSRLDAGVAALGHAKAQLQRYRQSVLAAAVTGQLAQGTNYTSVLFKDLIDGLGQGWSPKCDLNRPPEADEWAVIKTTAIQSMRYDDSEAKPLPPGLEPRPNIEIRDGDFLMTRKGPRKRAGVACYVPNTRRRLMICDTVYRFRCREDFVLPKYFELALNSPQVVHAIDKQKSGINESGVSLTHEKLGNVPIPIPPLADQHPIVAEVEARTTAIDHLESELDRQITRANRLHQSILASAFAGKL